MSQLLSTMPPVSPLLAFQAHQIYARRSHASNLDAREQRWECKAQKCTICEDL